MELPEPCGMTVSINGWLVPFLQGYHVSDFAAEFPLDQDFVSMA